MIGVDDLPIVEEIREHILNQEPVATQVYLIDIHPIDNLGLLQQFVQVALRVDQDLEPTQRIVRRMYPHIGESEFVERCASSDFASASMNVSNN